MFDLANNKSLKSLESVPSDFQAFYKQDGDEYILDTETPAINSAVSIISGMVNTLSAVRNEADTYKSKAVDLSSLADYGTSPEEIKSSITAKIEELQQQLAGGEEAKLNLEKIKEDLAKAHTKDLEVRDNRANALRSQLENLLVTSETIKELSAAGGDVELLSPFIHQNTKSIEEDGEFKVLVIDSAGDRRFSGTTGAPMTIKELVNEMKADTKYSKLFASEAPTGGGKLPGSSAAPAPKPGAKISSVDKISAGLKKNQHISSNSYKF